MSYFFLGAPTSKPSVIVLVSGDGDYLKLLTQMRTCGYTIVVISNEGSRNPKLHNIAHCTMSWSWLCSRVRNSGLATQVVAKRKSDPGSVIATNQVLGKRDLDRGEISVDATDFCLTKKHCGDTHFPASITLRRKVAPANQIYVQPYTQSCTADFSDDEDSYPQRRIQRDNLVAENITQGASSNRWLHPPGQEYTYHQRLVHTMDYNNRQFEYLRKVRSEDANEFSSQPGPYQRQDIVKEGITQYSEESESEDSVEGGRAEDYTNIRGDPDYADEEDVTDDDDGGQDEDDDEEEEEEEEEDIEEDDEEEEEEDIEEEDDQAESSEEFEEPTYTSQCIESNANGDQQRVKYYRYAAEEVRETQYIHRYSHNEYQDPNDEDGYDEKEYMDGVVSQNEPASYYEAWYHLDSSTHGDDKDQYTAGEDEEELAEEEEVDEEYSEEEEDDQEYSEEEEEDEVYSEEDEEYSEEEE